MKKTLILFIVAFATLVHIQAQDTVRVEPKPEYRPIEPGVRFMQVFTNFDVYNWSGSTVTTELTLSYGVGGFLAVNFNDNWAIQAEGIYNSLTQKSVNGNLERRINLRMLNIPLLLSFNTGKSRDVNLNLVAGPQIGINVGSTVRTSGDSDSTNVQAVFALKKGDLGFAYGAGLDFALDARHTTKLGIGFRGVYGLIDISDKSQSTTTESYYLLDRAHVNTYAGYIGLSVNF